MSDYTGRVYEDGAGWKWYERKDGSLVDGPTPDSVDATFESLDEYKKVNDDIPIWEKGDEIGKKRAWDADLEKGNADADAVRRAMEDLRPSKHDIAVDKQKALQKQKSLAERMRKAGMSVVKKGGPKLAALMGGPIGWGIAGIGALSDAQDAYAMHKAMTEPQDDREREFQKMMAGYMRNPTEYDR